jgi:putative ABC transport system permease protein
MGDAGFHRVTFTLGDALRLGLDYIKRRLDRTIINVASVALANSFLSSLILTDLFYKTFSQLETSSLTVEAYQYWLVFVALIVSIVGITNAMLIAVYERYREIGTMKCLGALDQHIMVLFLVESSIQGLTGGVIGYVFGVVAAIVSTGLTLGFGLIFKVSPSLLLFYFAGTTLLSVFLSVAASIYPAWRASKLRPVEALRYEL